MWFLDSDEIIRWQGKPDQQRYTRPSLTLCVLSLLWVIMGVFSYFLFSNAQAFAGFTPGVYWFLLSFFVPVLFPFIDIAIRTTEYNNMVYVVTDRHVYASYGEYYESVNLEEVVDAGVVGADSLIVNDGDVQLLYLDNPYEVLSLIRTK